MEKRKKIVLFGDSAFAEIAFEYFTHDSEFEPVAFTVSEDYFTKNSLFGLPVIPFEKVKDHYPPSEADMHISLTYNQMNRIRTRFYDEARAMGYTLANYISSKAFVWPNVTMGDNCFIFEQVIIQPFVKLGNNNILWSGGNIAHHATIGNNNFIGSHVVISGYCEVGDSNFMGVNSSTAHNIKIGSDCQIGASANIIKNVPSGAVIKAASDIPGEISTYEKFKLK